VQPVTAHRSSLAVGSTWRAPARRFRVGPAPSVAVGWCAAIAAGIPGGRKAFHGEVSLLRAAAEWLLGRRLPDAACTLAAAHHWHFPLPFAPDSQTRSLLSPACSSFLPSSSALQRELYYSDHSDVVHSATVLGRCCVHSLEQYRVGGTASAQPLHRPCSHLKRRVGARPLLFRAKAV
jgi:hypothetical protein